jgi:hypothetical protein
MNFLKNLKLGGKSKKEIDLPLTLRIPFEDEIIEFEKNNTKYILDKAILAKNLYLNKFLFKSIENYEELDNYLNGMLKYPLINKKEYLILDDPLLTNLFFFFWLGGSTCFKQLDKTCPFVKNTFDVLYTQAKDTKNKIVFNPFFLIQQPSEKRIINLKTEGRLLGKDGYILITLDNEVPGTFLIVNSKGAIKKWNLNDFLYFMTRVGNKKSVDLEYYDDLLNTIENARLESLPVYHKNTVKSTATGDKKQKSPSKSKKGVKFSINQNISEPIVPQLPSQIITYNFEDLFYSLCQHPLMEKELPTLFNSVIQLEDSWKSRKNLNPIGGPADRAKKLKKIDGALTIQKQPSQINKVVEEISKHTNSQKLIPTIYDITDHTEKGDQVVIYGNAPKKDIMIILEVIFGAINPFKMNSIITPEDFGRKPCVDTFTQGELYQKIQERFPYYSNTN